MKSAAHTMSTPHLGLEDALKLYARLGFDGVEVLYTSEYGCALQPTATASVVAELSALLLDLGLELAQLTPYAKDFDSEDAAKRTAACDEMVRCLELAAQLGSSGVRLWAGNEPEPGREDAQFERLVETLRSLGAVAAAAGVTLNLETHLGSQALTSSGTVRIIEAVGSPSVGVCYDPGNLLALGEADSVGALRRQLPYIRHVHFKDVRALGNREHAPTLVGDGDVPWSDLMPILRRGGYRGYVSTELGKRWHPELLPDSETGLRHELAALKRLWQQAEGQHA